MLSVNIHSAASLARIVSGDFDQEKLTLFAPVRNEIHIIPAWLEHHRAIGFEQFLFWDDASTDGTFEFLRGNPDCVIMKSDLSFGEKVRYTAPDGATTVQRIGIVFKSALPHALFQNVFVGYLDADEFLILPPGVGSIRDVVKRLEIEKSTASIASVVEFFPESITCLKKNMPNTFSTLVDAYPFIQAEKLITLGGAETDTKYCNPSKSKKLFATHGVSFPTTESRLEKTWRSFGGRLPKYEQGSPRSKTPLILRSAASFQVGSHKASLPPSTSTMLTIAHFVFTKHSYEKALRAIREEAHANNSRKYHGYVQLFEKMVASSSGFLDEQSVRYEGPEQLVRLELMHW
ncbi:hypothetical protein AL073_12660 [Loktanella sp. 1ANDIMAR09]|nr:hypothetical protein AL073_12660 [Loktanella sp. 1ANDIMAR09]